MNAAPPGNIQDVMADFQFVKKNSLPFFEDRPLTDVEIP